LIETTNTSTTTAAAAAAAAGVEQVVMLKHARDCKLQVFANILLKVNAKLGGLNAIPNAPLINDGDTHATIIFGTSHHYNL
jgi:hypothetical protein